MSPLFVLLAGAMLLAALAFVVLPLMRRGRAPDVTKRRALDDALAAGVISAEEHAAKLAALAPSANDAPAPRSRTAFASLLTVVLVLPAAAIGLYAKLGNPAAMDPAAAVPAASNEHGPNMDAAVANLAAKLKQNPDDAEGWLLLGRAYKSMQRFDEARDAVKQAYDRLPDNPDVQVDYAEALALASADRKLDGQSRELLEKAVKSNPQHQRGLWLLGVSDRQAERHADAIARWETLLAQMEPGSEAAKSVQAQIDEARSAGHLPATAAATPAAAGPEAKPESAASDIRLTVTVSLDAKLRAQAPADATVFVFARAASGPPMPLAVQRVKVSDLPTTVTLTEGMGMLPNLKLSQFPQVVIGARVSQSGNAMAQPGDLQTLSKPVDVKRTEPVEVTIDKVVQ
ncbi:c-type cytochrome biogenesis protein CcmI [Tahibacter soli]|uniref:C-type cytochrome biogenesis protein CcmI n=1 Tax=Tahibacter soli TaxID=2983605 RepID=A0A9X3YIH8_9GAMM|nr:c-type cytochrome biogenesis protein CcmI [Tahibacter soli]MDC8011701.1 c-type cytochrome biogenesis protein CcmI [Tahibacter soli]